MDSSSSLRGVGVIRAGDLSLSHSFPQVCLFRCLPIGKRSIRRPFLANRPLNEIEASTRFVDFLVQYSRN
jgi:hypothetical protein